MAAVYLCFLVALGSVVWLRLRNNWDLIGYVAVITSWRTPNPVELQSRVYQQIRQSTSRATYRALTTGPFRHDVAMNPWHLAEQLPFYSVKPLYLDMVWLIHQFGPGLIWSMHLLSVLSVLVLGFLCFNWMKIYLPDLQSAVISACLLITAPFYTLARAVMPDALNAVVLVSSLYLVFEKRKMFSGLLLLSLSVLIRPDSSILVLVVLVYLATLAPPGLAIRKLYALALAGTTTMSVAAIATLSGSYGWKVLFVNTFDSPIPNPGQITPVVTGRDYWVALRAAAFQLMNGYGLLLFVFFIALCLLIGVASLERGLHDLLILLLIAIALRIVLFPSLQARFYAFACVPAVVAFAACMAQRKEPDSGVST